MKTYRYTKEKIKTMIKAFIFDMDGTILDTIEDIAGAVNYILEKHDMPKRTVDEVKSFVGNGLYRTLELSVPENTDKTIMDRIYEEFVSYYKDHSNIKTKPYDGIVPVMRELKKQGYKLAVVSNKRQEAVSALCETFYDGIFEVSLGEQDGMRRKPYPDMVIEALNRMGVKKEEAVYVGDSDVDIMTAKNSNLKGIFVSWGFRSREFLKEHGAQEILDHPEQLIIDI